MKLSQLIIILIFISIVVLGGIFWLFRSGYFERADGPLEPWYATTNENGNPLLGVFEGRTPCIIDAECTKIKVGLALYQDQETKAPTTYKLTRVYVGKGDERTENEGNWIMLRGINSNPEAIVYQLDSNAPEEFRSHWAINQNILFILDQEMNPSVGTAAWSYVLNRVR